MHVRSIKPIHILLLVHSEPVIPGVYIYVAHGCYFSQFAVFVGYSCALPTTPHASSRGLTKIRGDDKCPDDESCTDICTLTWYMHIALYLL